MICKNCKQKITAEALFCPHCGSPQQKVMNIKSFLLGGAGILAVFLAVGIVYFHSYFKPPKDTYQKDVREAGTGLSAGNYEDADLQYEQSFEDNSHGNDHTEAGKADTSPELYAAFCAAREQENREQMEMMLVMARESVYDVLKAYDCAAMREYHAPSTADEIFKDGVIDEICGGNPAAKAAVSEAAECFRRGDELGAGFGKAMNAAVEAIPGIAREKFVELLVPECIRNMLNLYDSIEANSNLQIKYAIYKLQNGFQADTEALIAILLTEELTGGELREAAKLISDIYDTVYELENRFQISMGMKEWWLLDACLEGCADEYYRCGFLAESYRSAGEKAADTSAAAFTCTAEEVKSMARELDFYYQNTESFAAQYAWLLGIKDNLTTLRYFDYTKLQEDSAENFIAGMLSNTFGNFITDMFAAQKTEQDNLAVDVLYEYSDTCKGILEKHTEGFERLADIKLEVEALYEQLVNAGTGETELRCALYFYQDYFNGKGPDYDFYRDRIEGCAGEITAYYLLLKSAVFGQKALLNREFLTNSSYLAELDGDLALLEKAFYGENIQGMNFAVDISAETALLSNAYQKAVQYLCIEKLRVNDVYRDEYHVNTAGSGNFMLLCYRKRGLVSAYDRNQFDDAVIAMVLKKDAKPVFTCTFDCEGAISAACAEDGRFALYGCRTIGEGISQFGIMESNLSETDRQIWEFQTEMAGTDIYSDVNRTVAELAQCLR